MVDTLKNKELPDSFSSSSDYNSTRVWLHAMDRKAMLHQMCVQVAKSPQA